LIRDLTAHRTLGLRFALSEQPEVAIVAVTHTLAAQIFYRGADAHLLDNRPVSTVLALHAKAGKARAKGSAVRRRQSRCRFCPSFAAQPYLCCPNIEPVAVT